MADLTVVQATRNAGTAWTKNNGASSQTIDMGSYADENITILMENGDASNCRVKFSSNGYGGGGLDDIDVDITAGEFAVIVLESYIVKDPDTEKVTLQILDQDDTSFSGTVTNVKLSVINAPKGLTV